jgi:WGR domain-containing protein
MLDFRIALEARNPARGCLRHYRVEAGTDLFGTWVVQIGYGRIGTVGRSRSFVVRDEAQARRLTQSLLKRRATAPRRIGVAYRIIEFIDPAGWAESYGAMLTSAASPAGDFSEP